MTMAVINASHMENSRMLKRLLNNYGNVNILAKEPHP